MDSANTDALKIVFNEEPESTNGLLLIIPDRAVSPIEATAILGQSELSYRAGIVTGVYPDMFHVPEYVTKLTASCEQEKLRRLSLLGVGVGASLVQAFAISQLRLVRRVVLVDGTTRMAPSRLTRVVDWLERWLPLGLPLRSLSAAFDSRPQLHRLRCPTLVVSSPTAGVFERHQSEILAQTIPNCWRLNLTEPFDPHRDVLSSELAEALNQFTEIPTKRPQKNLAA